jgi:tetratricopeptide (TPR) repeat protein
MQTSHGEQLARPGCTNAFSPSAQESVRRRRQSNRLHCQLSRARYGPISIKQGTKLTAIADSSELLTVAQIARANGDFAGLRQAAEQALHQHEGEHITLIDIGNCARDAGLFVEADRIYQGVMERWPSEPFAFYELAVSRMAQGNHLGALDPLERILERDPLDARSNLLSTKILASLGDWRGAGINLRRHFDVVGSSSDFLILTEFLDFLAQFPRPAALRLARTIEREERFIGPKAIGTEIRKRLFNGEGYSLIRLGDGEGAYIQLSKADTERYRHLYQHNRNDRARIWFNDEIDLESSGFNRKALEINQVVRDADIVGVPYSTWVEHEYKILSMTGVSALTNVLRFVDEDPVAQGKLLARQTIHIDLYEEGVLDGILRDAPRVGIISCHTGLEGSLKRAYGIADITFLKLPGEKAMRSVLGEQAVEGSHWPERFREIFEQLPQNCQGTLFLIAGGILGKFYCNEVKRRGGVAVDIGSLADRWMGASTRPGYEAFRPL